jgi:2-polyprenyl-6-hydroxyphenyl methylase/3-demethylubiquinone-9 3-methyltransferase
MFDEAAERGTRQVDAQIAAGVYNRATFLMDAVSREVPPGGRILDYGCGAGRISLLMAKAGFPVVGIEPSGELARKAQEQEARGLPLQFWQTRPGEVDGVAAASFDAILCSSVIEFVSNPNDLLRKFRELLAPDGRLLLSFANRSSVWRHYAEWRFGGRAPHFKHQRNVWRETDAWRLLNGVGFIQAAPTTYFEAPSDAYPLLRSMSRLASVGTLGLIVARPAQV